MRPTLAPQSSPFPYVARPFPYVAVGWGRDYSDVTPSRGVFKGDAESELFVAVSTARSDEAAGELELVRVARPRSAKEPRNPPDAAYREYQQQ